jgi:hypothetical protein
MFPWTTTVSKTKEKVVGDGNRPLGLMLQWMIMVMLKAYVSQDLTKYEVSN